MSLVEETSPITAVPELDFYSKTPVQTSIESTYAEEIRPISQLNTGGHYEFIINNAINEYLKLKETTLYVKFNVKLSRTDTTTVSADDWKKVSVANNLLHSLWSQIDLIIGDTQTTTSLQTYPYRSYFETILGSTPNGRDTYLKSQLYTDDDMTSRDVINCDRQSYFTYKDGDITFGKSLELEGKLHLDLFMQDRSLIGGTKLRIKLIPHRPEFYFMCSDPKIIRVLFSKTYI